MQKYIECLLVCAATCFARCSRSPPETDASAKVDTSCFAAARRATFLKNRSGMRLPERPPLRVQEDWEAHMRLHTISSRRPLPLK